MNFLFSLSMVLLLLLAPSLAVQAKCSNFVSKLAQLLQSKERNTIEHFYLLTIGPEDGNTLSIIQRGNRDYLVSNLEKITWPMDSSYMYEFFLQLHVSLQENQLTFQGGNLSYSPQDLSKRTKKELITLKLASEQVKFLTTGPTTDFQITLEQEILPDSILQAIKRHLAKISPSLFSENFRPKIITILKFHSGQLTPSSLEVEVPGHGDRYRAVLTLPMEMPKFSADASLE